MQSRQNLINLPILKLISSQIIQAYKLWALKLTSREKKSLFQSTEVGLLFTKIKFFFTYKTLILHNHHSKFQKNASNEQH